MFLPVPTCIAVSGNPRVSEVVIHKVVVQNFLVWRVHFVLCCARLKLALNHSSGLGNTFNCASIFTCLDDCFSEEQGTQTQTFWSGYFRWGGGLPREGVGAKKFGGMYFETQGNQTFWRDPGILLRYSGILPRYVQRIARGAGEKGPRQKTSKIVKKCQTFLTLFDNFRAGQKTSKIVKECQKYFRHFSTIFARHQFSGPFWGL